MRIWLRVRVCMSVFRRWNTVNCEKEEDDDEAKYEIDRRRYNKIHSYETFV